MRLSPTGEPPLLELVEVMRRLRAECPWKAAQTHESLTRYLLEETYEVVEAIESGDRAHLREELGDLLLQVYFHAAIAAEDGAYDVQDVAADLVAKLVRRNPHVFGPGAGAPDALDAEAVNEAWEAVKAEEKQRSSPTEGIPEVLPALLRAVKVLERLERAGTPVTLPEEPDDLGDRLLVLAAEARERGLDPEQELRAAVRRLG